MADPDTTTPGKTTTKASDKEEFGAVLVTLDSGRVHDDATDLLAQVVAAVIRTHDKGKVTLTVEVEPLDPKTFEDTGILTVSGSVEAKIPRQKRAAAVYFATGIGGGITRDDPSRDDPRRDRD